jgi:hypothetical protein
MLIGVTATAASGRVPGSWSPLMALPAIVYIIDSILVNTTITFLAQQPIHRLRSVLLTLFNVFNVAMAFAVLYAVQPRSFGRPLSFIQVVYFSFVSMTTLGYGDIKPDGVGAWMGQLTVVIQLITSVYFFAGVLAVVVSWAQHRS